MALDAGGVDAIFLKSELIELEGSMVAAEETLLEALEAQPYNGNCGRIAGRYLLQHRIDTALICFQPHPMVLTTPCCTP